MADDKDLKWDGIRWLRHYDGAKWVEVLSLDSCDSPHLGLERPT
ncbi:MAG: hypothetical protein WCP28_15910 [Actinomycetes bacterium]